MIFQLLELDKSGEALLPGECRSCGWWQGHDDNWPSPERADSWSESALEIFGGWGKLAMGDDVLLGMIQYGPAGLFTRANDFACGPVSPDSVLFTCSIVPDTTYKSVRKSLVLSVLAELKERHIETVEAFCYQEDRPDNDCRLFDQGFLTDCGFYPVRSSRGLQLMRFELGGAQNAIVGKQKKRRRILERIKRTSPSPAPAAMCGTKDKLPQPDSRLRLIRWVALSRLPWLYSAVFFLFLALFLTLGLIGIDRSCLDAADSTYLVTSRALSEGQMPYRDFLVAHPPLLFLLGAPLAWLGAGVLPFRVFIIILMAGLGVAVWRLAKLITANDKLAMLAGAFTLFAPLGLFFSKTFINDYLVSLIAVLTILLLMGRSRAALVAAGVLGIIGTLSKLTILPFMVVCIIYVLIFRRKLSWIYIVVALGGSLAAALIAQVVTDGAYLSDIFGAQASKGYSLANLFDGLHRIWSMDWPLMVPAWAGAWFAWRALRKRGQLGGQLKGRLFLLVGWLLAGVAVLGTLPAEGHDTNLFLMAEPAVAVFAAWGIAGLAERGTFAPLLLIAIWLVVAIPNLADKSQDFFFRSNVSDVAVIVAETQNRSTVCQPVLIPGCYAVEAERPVTLDYYDPFLWEEKYKRGDQNAIEMIDGLKQDVAQAKPPVVVFEEGQPTAGYPAAGSRQ